MILVGWQLPFSHSPFGVTWMSSCCMCTTMHALSDSRVVGVALLRLLHYLARILVPYSVVRRDIAGARRCHTAVSFSQVNFVCVCQPVSLVLATIPKSPPPKYKLPPSLGPSGIRSPTQKSRRAQSVYAWFICDCLCPPYKDGLSSRLVFETRTLGSDIRYRQHR